MRSEWPDKFVTNLDWNLLRTFVVIVQEGSITAAATKLLLRQPTVSLALQRLETHMECRLIERGRGTFRLTAVGKELYRECVDIYGGIANLKDVANSAAQEITGEIHIVLASHVATPLFDELLASFHKENPKVTYRISIDTSVAVAQRVSDKSASLGICLLNKKLPQLDYEIIYREFFGFFCGPPHPLFGKKNLQMEDLRDHVAVSFGTDDMADALRPVAMLRKQYELGQRIVGQSQHLEEVKRMIMCGLGIGPLPVHVVDKDVQEKLLWRLPPYTDPPAVDIYLLTNPRKRHNQAEIGFIKALKAKIAGNPMDTRTYPAFHRAK